MNKKKCTEELQLFLPQEADGFPDGPLPRPDEISYYVLENERILYFDYDVNHYVMEIHRMIVRWNLEDTGVPMEERKPIKIFIMSLGGELSFMWSLLDVMMTSETPIYTVNIGVAASAAALLFLAGDKRFMFPSSVVMIHEGSASMSGDSTKIIDASEDYKRELKRMKDFILSRTDIPKAQLSKKRNNDWSLDAAKCLEYGVATDVVHKLSEVLD